MDEREQSLIDRAAARLARPTRSVARSSSPPIDWRFAAGLAAVIALGPLLTIVSAGVLARHERAEMRDLAKVAGPIVTAAKTDRAARGRLREAAGRLPVAAWLDRAARALPADARVTAMRLASDGGIEIDVLTPDPDPVRAALRSDVALAGFRESSQRRAQAMILVTYRRAA